MGRGVVVVVVVVVVVRSVVVVGFFVVVVVVDCCCCCRIVFSCILNELAGRQAGIGCGCGVVAWVGCVCERVCGV